jgi:hypothetical protein
VDQVRVLVRGIRYTIMMLSFWGRANRPLTCLSHPALYRPQEPPCPKTRVPSCAVGILDSCVRKAQILEDSLVPDVRWNDKKRTRWSADIHLLVYVTEAQWSLFSIFARRLNHIQRSNCNTCSSMCATLNRGTSAIRSHSMNATM